MFTTNCVIYDNILFDIDGLVQVALSKFLNKPVCVATNDGKNLEVKEARHKVRLYACFLLISVQHQSSPRHLIYPNNCCSSALSVFLKDNNWLLSRLSHFSFDWKLHFATVTNLTLTLFIIIMHQPTVKVLLHWCPIYSLKWVINIKPALTCFILVNVLR